MWTAIWTVLGFILLLALLLFLGDSILAFTAEQLRQRRAYRLRLERERTNQALFQIFHDCCNNNALTCDDCCFYSKAAGKK